jgi:SAM-dependent methyltransferase
MSPARWDAPDRSFAGHRDIYTRSMARYHFVAPHLSGTVLDVGCGRGYGFEVMPPAAHTHVGVDLAYDFLREARQRLTATSFVCASGVMLPFSRGTFCAITAFEVLEHVEHDRLFLEELRRVARAGAFIAISTPNILIASGNSAEPLAHFHAREYSGDDFRGLLRQFFSSVILFGQYDAVRKTHFSRLVDRIPLRWKYRFPAFVQGLASVALRPRLRLDECRFRRDHLDSVHTFVALCRP